MKRKVPRAALKRIIKGKKDLLVSKNVDLVVSSVVLYFGEGDQSMATYYKTIACPTTLLDGLGLRLHLTITTYMGWETASHRKSTLYIRVYPPMHFLHLAAGKWL
jgi:hypothetical protein